MHRRGLLIFLTAAVGMLALTGTAWAATVNNGDFETGTLSGWTAVNQPGGSGSWYAYSAAAPPAEACTPPPAGPPFPPPQGTYAATSDESNPGSHVLYQDIALEPNAKHNLSFTLYYKTIAPSFATPPTLDYTTRPNQQYRVDVLKPGSDPFSVASSDVLENLFQTKVGDPQTLAPTPMTFNLSQFAGQSVRLRFADVETQNCMLASVDAVAVKSSPTANTGGGTNITKDSATLHGGLNPQGQATSYRFQYGKSKSYGKQTPSRGGGSDSSWHSVTATLKNLKPNTVYHYRIVATNGTGTAFGQDRTFRTKAVSQPRPGRCAGGNSQRGGANAGSVTRQNGCGNVQTGVGQTSDR